MKSPDRIAALRNARKVIKNRDRKISKMKLHLDRLTSNKGVELGSDMQEEILSIIQEHHPKIETLPMSDFRRVFWNQQVNYHIHRVVLAISAMIMLFCNQVSALKVKAKTAVRWHPLFIRWCLNISRVSPKAYEILRESGLKLPTRRTLNDYTHWISTKPGYQHEVDEFLMKEAKIDTLEDWQR